MRIPVESRTAQVNAEALIHRLICKFGPPKYLILDKDSVHLIHSLHHKFLIKNN